MIWARSGEHSLRGRAPTGSSLLAAWVRDNPVGALAHFESSDPVGAFPVSASGTVAPFELKA
jgi:hypothetical protein